jgi:hypothetical protein
MKYIYTYIYMYITLYEEYIFRIKIAFSNGNNLSELIIGK